MPFRRPKDHFWSVKFNFANLRLCILSLQLSENHFHLSAMSNNVVVVVVVVVLISSGSGSSGKFKY